MNSRKKTIPCKAGEQARQVELPLLFEPSDLIEGEKWAASRGYACCVGVDEVGRGPMAGPVVAAAVWLSDETRTKLMEMGLNDSKKLSAKKRELLASVIHDEGIASIGRREAECIDEINILRACFQAMGDALVCLSEKLLKLGRAPDIVLVDGNAKIEPHPLPGVVQHTLTKGDQRSISIAAASVIAKVYRDSLMVSYDNDFPGYGFGSNKGYLSAFHKEALSRLGPCPIHRMSFRGAAGKKSAYGKD